MWAAGLRKLGIHSLGDFEGGPPYVPMVAHFQKSDTCNVRSRVKKITEEVLVLGALFNTPVRS